MHCFDTDPLDTTAAIKAAKRRIVAFDSAHCPSQLEHNAAAHAYATLLAHESPDWVVKHRALDRFCDTLFRPFTQCKHHDASVAVPVAVDWFRLFTNPANTILFSCTEPDSLSGSDSESRSPDPHFTTSTAFTNPSTNTLASLRSDWPPSLQLASLTTAAHLARALAPLDRENAPLYLAHTRSYLLAARSLFPGCGKVDRLLATLALAVRPPVPTHQVEVLLPPHKSCSSESQQQKRPRGHHATIITTVWATPTTREIDALYHLTCAQCAATDPSPDDAALDKLLQPVHEWDMLGPAAQALQARHPSNKSLVLAPVSALLAWYCRLFTRTSLERVADLVTHLLTSLKNMDDPDRHYKVAIIAIGLTFHLRTTPAVATYALESLISLLSFSTSALSPTVWTALVSRGLLACPSSTLALASTTALARLESHLNKVPKSAKASDTALAHKWLSGLDPNLYPYPLTEPLERTEVHSWWAAHLESGTCRSLAYDATNKRTPFTLTGPLAEPATLASPQSLQAAAPLAALGNTPTQSPTPPLYVFDTNTLLNHLSLLYQSTHVLTLPLAVMYELAGLQHAADAAVARHATLAWGAMVDGATMPPGTPAPSPVAQEVKPATASISVYTSRGSRLSVAQVIKGVSEDYRNRGGLDNVVLDTCVALAGKPGVAAPAHTRAVVLVTDDLNLRLKAQGRGVRTCGVADVVEQSTGGRGSVGDDDKVGGLRVGELVRFARGGGGEAGRGKGRRNRGGGKPSDRQNAQRRDDGKVRRAGSGGDARRKKEGGQPPQQPQRQGQEGRVCVQRNRRRSGHLDTAVE